MNFSETAEFQKNFKRLGKKYRSLPDDLLEFKKVVAELPLGGGKHFVILHNQGGIKVVKARFFCRYLKGSSLRVIYAYLEKDAAIDFIEIYFKGEQTGENKLLIKNYLKKLNERPLSS
ncbi:MAG TPA: hypothetical protein VJJ72_00620 [Candidatus Paceibacterota bacterium]